MRPFISVVDLTALSVARRKRICECKSQCEKGITLSTHNDGLIMCWNDARKTLYDLNSQMNEGAYTTWTDKDEELLIEHYKTHGNYRGIQRVLADMLGKSQSQVKSKVTRLRKHKRL